MESKQRGRIRGDVKLISKIEDPALGKFHIEINEDGYNLMETGKPTPTGYFSTISGCLHKTSRLLAHNGTTYNLKEYIDQYKNILEQLKHLFND